MKANLGRLDVQNIYCVPWKRQIFLLNMLKMENMSKRVTVL